MGENGELVARADIGMRLVMDVKSYAEAGTVMDLVQAAVRDVAPAKARFDFTHFQTRPCKTAVMSHLAVAAEPMGEDAPGPW